MAGFEQSAMGAGDESMNLPQEAQRESEIVDSGWSASLLAVKSAEESGNEARRSETRVGRPDAKRGDDSRCSCRL